MAYINTGELDSFRAPNREGLPGRRKVSRQAMDRWIQTLTNHG